MKDILEFLGELKSNNHKQWMDENRNRYQKVKKKFEDTVKILIERIALFDPEIAGIQPKNCIFRLNRDIRFSQDKRPYKENFGAFISKEGKKGFSGGYYVHLEPGSSMLAGGSYMPPSDVLSKIRQEIDYNPDPLLKFINSKDFKNLFGSLRGEKLKTAPKGYSSDHPYIDLINYKSYIVMHNLKDEEVTNPDFIDICISKFKAMKPLNDFIRIALDG